MSATATTAYPVIGRLEAGELDSLLPEHSRRRARAALDAARRIGNAADQAALLQTLASQLHYEMGYLRLQDELRDLNQVAKGTRPCFAEAREFTVLARSILLMLRQRVKQTRSEIAAQTPDHAAVGHLFRLEHDADGSLQGLDAAERKLHAVFASRDDARTDSSDE